MIQEVIYTWEGISVFLVLCIKGTIIKIHAQSVILFNVNSMGAPYDLALLQKFINLNFYVLQFFWWYLINPWFGWYCSLIEEVYVMGYSVLCGGTRWVKDIMILISQILPTYSYRLLCGSGVRLHVKTCTLICSQGCKPNNIAIAPCHCAHLSPRAQFNNPRINAYRNRINSARCLCKWSKNRIIVIFMLHTYGTDAHKTLRANLHGPNSLIYVGFVWG